MDLVGMGDIWKAISIQGNCLTRYTEYEDILLVQNYLLPKRAYRAKTLIL